MFFTERAGKLILPRPSSPARQGTGITRYIPPELSATIRVVRKDHGGDLASTQVTKPEVHAEGQMTS